MKKNLISKIICILLSLNFISLLPVGEKVNFEKLPVYQFVNQIKDGLKDQNVSDRNVQEFLDASLSLILKIGQKFDTGVFYYNPEIFHKFLKTHKTLKPIKKLSLRDLEKFKEEIKDFNSKIIVYLNKKSAYLSDDEKALLQEILTLNGSVVEICDKYLQFSASEHVTDILIHKPWKFICDYKEVSLPIITLSVVSVYYFLLHPYLKKLISTNSGNNPNGAGKSNPSFTKFKRNGTLKNLGNTCYMNATLQCISNMESLREYLIAHKSDYKDNNIALEFINLLEQLRQEKDFIRPVDFRDISSDAFFGGNRFRQQDAHELLTPLLDILFDVKREAAKKDLSALIGVQLESTCVCAACGNSKNKFDPGNIISVPLVADNCSLKDCFQEFIKSETLDGENAINCEKCKEKTLASLPAEVLNALPKEDALAQLPEVVTKQDKKLKLVSLPENLIVQLKRFSFELDGSRKKLDNAVSVPLKDFDLKPYLSDKIKDKPDNTQYDLVGFVCHSGVADTGHYISYTKDFESKQWVEYNDESCTEKSEAEIKQITENANCGYSTPYLLFYQKKK